MRRIITMSFALAFILTLTLTSWSVATAAPTCGDGRLMRDRLVSVYGEVLAFSAVTSNGFLQLIYVNPETRTWSMVMTYPNGVSCLIKSGDGWEGPFTIKEERHATTR